ncbi:hypothetical protein ACNOYE_27910 [Nannocystaceae bacterium ST9]
MLTRRRLVTACALLVATVSGCGIGDLFTGSTSTVKFFATHAGTPDEAGFPNYGEAGSTRVFMTDMGWEVALEEIYVTTANIRLVRCGKQKGTDIEMFWGTCPEDFILTEDRETLPLGAVTIDDGSFCAVEVIYAPYVDDGDSDEHINPSNPEVVGKTVLISGVARRDIGNDMLEEVPFSFTSAEKVVAVVDISTLEAGGPVHLEKENFARNLTVLKNYDQFFSGIDFASATQADFEAAVLAGLELDTRVYDGATVTN